MTCECPQELETCLATVTETTENLLSRFGNCLKAGNCPHWESTGTHRMCGFHWIHLSIIMNKKLILKYLIPFFREFRNQHLMQWWTVHNSYSVLYLMLIHNRSLMLCEILKYTDDINMKTSKNVYITECPSFKMAIEMDNASVLKMLKAKATGHQLELLNVKECLNLAFNSRAYDTFEFFMTDYPVGYENCKTMFDAAINSGNNYTYNYTMI